MSRRENGKTGRGSLEVPTLRQSQSGDLKIRVAGSFNVCVVHRNDLDTPRP